MAIPHFHGFPDLEFAAGIPPLEQPPATLYGMFYASRQQVQLVEPCSICYARIEQESMTIQHRADRTSHVFHRACMLTWFQTQREQRRPLACPLCLVQVFNQDDFEQIPVRDLSDYDPSNPEDLREMIDIVHEALDRGLTSPEERARFALLAVNFGERRKEVLLEVLAPGPMGNWDRWRIIRAILRSRGSDSDDQEIVRALLNQRPFGLQGVAFESAVMNNHYGVMQELLAHGEGVSLPDRMDALIVAIFPFVSTGPYPDENQASWYTVGWLLVYEMYAFLNFMTWGYVTNPLIAE